MIALSQHLRCGHGELLVQGILVSFELVLFLKRRNALTLGFETDERVAKLRIALSGEIEGGRVVLQITLSRVPLLRLLKELSLPLQKQSPRPRVIRCLQLDPPIQIALRAMTRCLEQLRALLE